MQEKLWKQRNLSRFNLDTGTLHHNLALKSDPMGIHGIVDMAIETDELVHAVEFKLSAQQIKRKDMLQLSAYAMLLEEYFSKPSPVGFLSGQGKILHVINIDYRQR